MGVEVIPPARRVLEKVGRLYDAGFAFQDFDWGSQHYFRWGHMMPAGALDLLQPCDAILLGAVGHPDIPDHTTLNGLLLPIRRAFDLYANVRPAYLYPGVESPLRKPRGGDIDFVVVRENTEGEYAQVGGLVYQHQPEEIAIQTSVFTRRAIERIVRFAFDLAVRRGKKRRVTSVTKSNAQGYSMTLWDRVFEEAAARHPDIETESLLVDAAAMNFIRRPETFDVVVGSNLFGDILSDISAIVDRQHGPGGQRQSRSRAAVPLHVRAGARLRARYRGQGRGEPAGRHPQRVDDARPLGAVRSRGESGTRRGRGAGGRRRRARATWAARAAPKKWPRRCWRRSPSGAPRARRAHRPPRIPGGGGHSAEPPGGPGPPERVLELFRNLLRRRRFQRGMAHSQLSAEPFRRRRALGVVHPGLRAPAGGRG